MDFRGLTGKAASRIKEVFSKDNRFFYGNKAPHQDEYQQDLQQAPAQGIYQNMYAQPQYTQQAAQQQAQNPYAAPYQNAPQQPAQYQQPYQQVQYQQPRQQAAQEYQQPWQQPQAPYQAPQMQQYAQHIAPQQAQFQSQQQVEQQGRNRRAAQHLQEQQSENNIVQFPGAVSEPEGKAMDAYVVNITNIAGCRQAMTCLRKGQCTLVVMDQLIDKAEVRRYVDMLNGACFALGGTMTRLSLKIGFYLLAPSGMMVYTDPLTASANNPRPQQPQQQPQPYHSQPGFQQPVYQQQQPAPQQQAYYAQPQQAAGNPYAPPGSPAQEYAMDPYDAQRYAQ